MRDVPHTKAQRMQRRSFAIPFHPPIQTETNKGPLMSIREGVILGGLVTYVLSHSLLERFRVEHLHRRALVKQAGLHD